MPYTKIRFRMMAAQETSADAEAHGSMLLGQDCSGAISAGMVLIICIQRGLVIIRLMQGYWESVYLTQFPFILKVSNQLLLPLLLESFPLLLSSVAL